MPGLDVGTSFIRLWEATEDIKVILMKISLAAMSKVFWDLKSLGTYNNSGEEW